MISLSKKGHRACLCFRGSFVDGKSMVLSGEIHARNQEDRWVRQGYRAGPVQRVGKNGDYIVLQIDRFFSLEEIWQNLVVVLKPHMVVSNKTETGEI